MSLHCMDKAVETPYHGLATHMTRMKPSSLKRPQPKILWLLTEDEQQHGVATISGKHLVVLDLAVDCRTHCWLHVHKCCRLATLFSYYLLISSRKNLQHIGFGVFIVNFCLCKYADAIRNSLRNTLWCLAHGVIIYNRIKTKKRKTNKNKAT